MINQYKLEKELQYPEIFIKKHKLTIACWHDFCLTYKTLKNNGIAMTVMEDVAKLLEQFGAGIAKRSFYYAIYFE